MKNIDIEKPIRGASGGDDSSDAHVPIEFPDTLQSAASAQIVDLVGEGEIEGLVNGLQSIYLDGTPLQNPDGTYNYQGVYVQARYGSQTQPYIGLGYSKDQVLSGEYGNAFLDTENEISVGVNVTAAAPVTRTITNPNVTACRVYIACPQLSFSDSGTGDLSGSSVVFHLFVQSAGSGFRFALEDGFTGKSMSKYERSFRLRLADYGPPPYDIRVTRITPDSTASSTQNKIQWESYTEIVETSMIYPNSAIFAVRVKAAQFSRVPTRAYDLKLLKVRVPTNYNPITRAYTGTWDGTFKVLWSDNPAWAFYDILTTARYGLGNFISEDQVDKWALYQIAKYCDELVPDGFGGFEPRFTCNVYIQSREEAYKVVNDLASVFRGMAYWASGAITVAQDSPQDPGYLFTPANVVDGVFNYVGVSQKARHSVALVAWNDPNDLYRQKIEYVEDSELVAEFGVIETQITAMGCTSRGQAHRLGKWTLLTERYQSETVTFQTGIEGAIARPGMVIKIADPVRAGMRCGGRVSSATTSSVTADADIPTLAAEGLKISVLLPNGVVYESLVTSISGRTINFINGTSAAQTGAIWILQNAQVEAQQFRVVTVTESKPGFYDITALAHNPNKFAAVDNDTILEPRGITALSATPEAPSDVSITETLYAVGTDVRTKVTVSWRMVNFASNYVVQYKRDSQNVVSLPPTSQNDLDILAIEPGTYTFWVIAVSPLGKRSAASTVVREIRGKGAEPHDVQNFSMIPQADMAYLSWDQTDDLDVLIGGSVRIRWSPNTLTPLWKEAVDIVPLVPGTATRVQAPLLPGTYMAKFVDSSGIASNHEAILVTTIPIPLALNVVQTIIEDPAFSGTRTNMDYRADLGGLCLSSTAFIDSLPDIDSVASFDFLGGISPVGEYLFAGYTDLGAVFTSTITATIAAAAVDVSDTIDQRLTLIDDWLDLDGAYIDDVNAAVYLRTTEDNPSGTPVWSAWKPFFVGDYRARGIQFKVIATSDNQDHTVVVKNLKVVVDMPDRAVNMAALVSSTSTYHVTFEAPFAAVPSIGISGHNMNSGDYFQIANKTNSGFDITFYNSSGAMISRTFDVLAKGYGRAS